MKRAAWASVGAAILAVVVWSCSDAKGPTGPEPWTVEAPAPEPVGSASAPAVVPATGGHAWESNGLRVSVLADDWGPGTCHTSGGRRTFLLENVGDVARYSNLSAFTDDDLACVTDETPTGKPRHGGCLEVAPGASCEFWIEVTRPDGKGGVCGLQVDDCWGPGGIKGCAFVAGDGFKADTCEKTCVEGEWTEKAGSRKRLEGLWGACPIEPSAAAGYVSSLADVAACYECRTITETWVEANGCEDRPAEAFDSERRPIDCPCVEGGPYETCGEWGECHDHPGTELCYQHAECSRTWDCKKPEPFEDLRECPCVCVDKPTGVVLADPSGNPFRASATVEDSGAWRLRIHASSHESECLSDRPDYWKRTVPKTTVCDERGVVEASYTWAGHGSEWWRAVLELDGTIVDRSACVRNPFN